MVSEFYVKLKYHKYYDKHCQDQSEITSSKDCLL